MHRSLDMLIVGQRMMHTLPESTHYTTIWENGKQGQELGPFLAHSLTLAIGSFIGDLDQISTRPLWERYSRLIVYRSDDPPLYDATNAPTTNQSL